MGNGIVVTGDIYKTNHRIKKNKKLMSNYNPFEEKEELVNAKISKMQVKRKPKIKMKNKILKFESYVAQMVDMDKIKQVLKIWAKVLTYKKHSNKKIIKIWGQYTHSSEMIKYKEQNQKKYDYFYIDDDNDDDNNLEEFEKIKHKYKACFNCIKGVSFMHPSKILVDYGIYIGGKFQLAVLTEGEGPYGAQLANFACRKLISLICERIIDTSLNINLKILIKQSIHELDELLSSEQDKNYWNLAISGINCKTKFVIK